METHTHHPHTAPKKWTHYLFEFFMLFLAVFAGFLAEQMREHMVERTRAHQFLESMLMDVQTNIKNLDSLVHQDRTIIADHDSLMNWLLADSATIDRAAFARKMGAVWIRNFLVRKETYEQMKSSGSLRYIGNIEFLKKMMDYERVTNLRNSETRNLKGNITLNCLSRPYIKLMILPARSTLIPAITLTLSKWKNLPVIMMC